MYIFCTLFCVDNVTDCVSAAEECLRCVHIILCRLKHSRFRSSVSQAKCRQGLITCLITYIFNLSVHYETRSLTVERNCAKFLQQSVI